MSEVAICNRALLLLGASPITSFNENTNEGRLCRDHYDDIRDALLEAREWRFATDRRQLIPVTQTLAGMRPTLPSEVAFQAPHDCLRILNLARVPVSVWDADDVEYVQEGKIIYAKAPQVAARYIFRQEAVGMFSPLFTEALITRVAAEFAMALTGSQGKMKELYELAQNKLNVADIANSKVGHEPRPEGTLAPAGRR